MTDILAILDAAVAEIGRRNRSKFPLFPSAAEPEGGTGTSNHLENNRVPALPVVPAEHSIIQVGIEHVRENTPAEGNGNGDSAPTKYTFKDTGTTGSTGTPEDFCRSDNSRELLEHGNYGNPAARSAITVEPEFPEIAHLAEHGLVIDFETRSVANLKEVGPFVYADRGWTQVWVACYAIGKGPVRVWRPGESVPADVAAHVRSGLPLIAHNASFERAIWNKIMTPRHGWPEPKLEQWHCTAAMAAAMALPRKLEEAAKVLACSSQKDMSGHRLMLQMARPCSTENVPCFLCGAVGEEASDANCPCQHDTSWRIMVKWLDDTESMKRGMEYCIRDVETERELLTKLRPLPAMEREVWLLDQRINERGVSIDVTAVHSARRIVGDRLKELNAELDEVTKGAVGAATQIEKLIAWLRSMGVELPNGAESNDLDKEQINVLLKRELPAECRRALLIRLEAAKTSTSKLDAYAQRTNPDGRMRDNLIFHGAGRTGRWSGKGAQLQNVPRPPASMKPAEIEDALKFIIEGRALKDFEESFHGIRGLEIISGCLRAMLRAAPGHHLIAADYNAIEARGTAWLAGAIGMLSVFQRNEDPYLYMACQIYNMEQGSLTKKDNPMERQLGKIAVLGLGYQMGAERFRQTCGKDGVLITCEQAEEVKQIYRESNSEIVRLWRELQDAAIRAVQAPGTCIDAANGRLSFVMDGMWLNLRLPSGRLLTYANPRYELAETRFGQRWTVTFEGVNSITHKWEKQQAYGGKWCENAVQAICRDLLANAMLNLEAAGYSIVLSVHDEIVAEVPEEFGTVQEFEHIMCQLPDWANCFPVKAEGWRANRFQK